MSKGPEVGGSEVLILKPESSSPCHIVGHIIPWSSIALTLHQTTGHSDFHMVWLSYACLLFTSAMACRAWTAYLVEVKQQRARQEAEQQQLAEQHHRQVLIRGLWEGLGQALALRRIAQHDAHRHYQLCRQRLVSMEAEAHIHALALWPGIFIHQCTLCNALWEKICSCVVGCT